jgi:hypothetical protein
LSSLIKAGFPVAGIVLSKTIDVDRPGDIPQAESLIKETPAWLAA